MRASDRFSRHARPCGTLLLLQHLVLGARIPGVRVQHHYNITAILLLYHYYTAMIPLLYRDFTASIQLLSNLVLSARVLGVRVLVEHARPEDGAASLRLHLRKMEWIMLFPIMRCLLLCGRARVYPPKALGAARALRTGRPACGCACDIWDGSAFVHLTVPYFFVRTIVHARRHSIFCL